MFLTQKEKNMVIKMKTIKPSNYNSTERILLRDKIFLSKATQDTEFPKLVLFSYKQMIQWFIFILLNLHPFNVIVMPSVFLTFITTAKILPVQCIQGISFNSRFWQTWIFLVYCLDWMYHHFIIFFWRTWQEGSWRERRILRHFTWFS